MKNIITEILELISFIREQQQKHPDNEELLEVLNDVSGRLSVFMSSCLTSPIHARLSLALPQAYLNPDQQQQSLMEQKAKFFDTT